MTSVQIREWERMREEQLGDPMAKLDRIEHKLDLIYNFLQKLTPDRPSTEGPPYTGPAVYKRTLTQEDLSRAFQDGRHSHYEGMP